MRKNLIMALLIIGTFYLALVHWLGRLVRK